MNISERLKQLRENKGITQEKISADLNMNRATYAHYETGRRQPDLDTVKLLARYYNCSTDYLLGHTDIMDPFDGGGIVPCTETYSMKFSERLRMLREEKGTAQKELGDIIGVSDRVVSYYEAGRFPKDEAIISKIADYFDVSTDYLLGRSDIRNPYKIKDVNACHYEDEWTDEEFEDIQRFKEFVKMKREQKKQ